MVAIYACDIGWQFENAQYNRMYCSQGGWIQSSYFPTCISTGEPSDGKHFEKRFHILKLSFQIFIVFRNMLHSIEGMVLEIIIIGSYSF